METTLAAFITLRTAGDGKMRPPFCLTSENWEYDGYKSGFCARHHLCSVAVLLSCLHTVDLVRETSQDTQECSQNVIS